MKPAENIGMFQIHRRILPIVRARDLPLSEELRTFGS